MKKGAKANHQQRGIVTLLSNPGDGPNKGTLVKLDANHEEFEASTVYLREIKHESGVATTDSGT